MRQLNLSIDIRSDARLSDFAGQGWSSVIDAVRQMHTGHLSRCYIYGNADTGKSHLLSAICESYIDMGLTAIQVPLVELISTSTEALQSIESFDLVALDDLDMIFGHAEWEEAIYHLINRSVEKKLIFAARTPVNQIQTTPELHSRLAQAASYKLPTGDNLDDRRALLYAVLKRNGWNFDPQITEYIITHGPNLPGLMFKMLEELKPLFETRRRKPSLSMIKQTLSMIDERLQLNAVS